MGNKIDNLLFQPPLTKIYELTENDGLIYLRNKLGSKIFCYYIDNKAKYTIIYSHG